MPMYDFECHDCGHVEEAIVAYESRCVPRRCPKCSDSVMHLAILKAPAAGTAYQFKARFGDPVTGKILGDVPGHVGKTAKRKRKK